MYRSMGKLKIEGGEICGGELTIATHKKVAEIVLCGAVHFTILDTVPFIRPTEEQIKNLKDVFCIDVKLFEESEEEII